jgi:hypothetical protein
MAAITTSPSPMVEVLAFDRTRAGPSCRFRHVGVEHVVHVGQRNAVLRALGAGQRGHDRRQVEFERRGEDRLDGGSIQKPCSLA